MKKIIKKWLGVEQLEQDLRKLESRLSAFETATTEKLNSLGRYKVRSESELKEMKIIIECMIDTCEVMVKDAENESRNEVQVKPLLRRLRNNHTRICNALEAA